MGTNKIFSNMGNIDHYNRSHKNLSVQFFPFRELTPCCTFLKNTILELPAMEQGRGMKSLYELVAIILDDNSQSKKLLLLLL